MSTKKYFLEAMDTPCSTLKETQEAYNHILREDGNGNVHATLTENDDQQILAEFIYPEKWSDEDHARLHQYSYDWLGEKLKVGFVELPTFCFSVDEIITHCYNVEAETKEEALATLQKAFRKHKEVEFHVSEDSNGYIRSYGEIVIKDENS